MVAAATFLVYFPSLRNQMTNWDDPVHVTENTDVQGLDFTRIKKIFHNTVNDTYIPLAVLSYAFEYHFFGHDALPYHLDNLFLHLAVVILLFFFARGLGASALAAAAAGLIFGVHPMHVETVAWVTERKGLLYSVFYLSSLIFYCRYVKSKNLGYLALAFLAAVLSILSKPMALSLPLVLLVCDLFYQRRDVLKIIVEKIPFLVLAAAVAAVTFYSHPEMVQAKGPWFQAVLILVWTFAFYLCKFFWPDLFVPDYAMPWPVSVWLGPYALALGVVLLFALGLWRWRTNRFLIFACLYYLFSIFFVLKFSFHPKGMVADRFMYLPSAGFCVLCGVLADQLINRWQEGSAYRKCVYAGLLLIALILGAKTCAQTKVWHDSISLWSYVIGHTAHKTFHYYNRGAAYTASGDFESALSDLNKAVELNQGDDEAAYSYRATAYYDTGRYDEAIADINTLLKRHPGLYQVYLNRGTFYMAKGDYAHALADFERFLRIEPDNVEVLNNRGTVYRLMNKLGLAFENYDRALGLDPDFIDALDNRATAYIAVGKMQEARRDLERALVLSPDNLSSLHNRAVLNTTEGKIDAAIADYGHCIRLKPSDKSFYLARGLLYGNEARYELAADDFSTVIQIDPSDAQAYYFRAYAYQNLKMFAQARDDFAKAKSLK